VVLVQEKKKQSSVEVASGEIFRTKSSGVDRAAEVEVGVKKKFFNGERSLSRRPEKKMSGRRTMRRRLKRKRQKNLSRIDWKTKPSETGEFWWSRIPTGVVGQIFRFLYDYVDRVRIAQCSRLFKTLSYHPHAAPTHLVVPVANRVPATAALRWNPPQHVILHARRYPAPCAIAMAKTFDLLRRTQSRDGPSHSDGTATVFASLTLVGFAYDSIYTLEPNSLPVTRELVWRDTVDDDKSVAAWRWTTWWYFVFGSSRLCRVEMPFLDLGGDHIFPKERYTQMTRLTMGNVYACSKVFSEFRNLVELSINRVSDETTFARIIDTVPLQRLVIREAAPIDLRLCAESARLKDSLRELSLGLEQDFWGGFQTYNPDWGVASDQIDAASRAFYDTELFAPLARMRNLRSLELRSTRVRHDVADFRALAALDQLEVLRLDALETHAQFIRLPRLARLVELRVPTDLLLSDLGANRDAASGPSKSSEALRPTFDSRTILFFPALQRLFYRTQELRLSELPPSPVAARVAYSGHTPLGSDERLQTFCR
jgi:hypothetical protein